MEIKKIGRKAIKKTDIFVFSLLMGSTLVLINIFSSFFFKRLDLTVSQKYSLSSVTKDKLEKLDDLVNIRAYFSKQLPPRFTLVKQEVMDFLNDYQSYSRGKLKITYFDPLADPNFEREALSYGIPQLQFSDMEKDKFQVQNGFLGLVVLYEDRYEVLPVVENIQNLEYDLTSIILKVLVKNKKRIALATFSEDNQLTPINDEFRLLKIFLEKQYQVTPISLKNQPVDKTVNTLVIVGDKVEISDYEKYQIDQFIMSGKGVLFLVNGVSLNEGLSGTLAGHNLFDLLESYGVKVNSDLVLDSYSDIASFQSGYTTFLAPYPFWPKIRREGFTTKNPVVAKLETLTVQWPSSITLKKDNQKKANFETLIKSSKKSWASSQITNLSPQQKFSPAESDLKESNLAVLVTGKITSFYSDKQIPTLEEKEETTSPSMALPLKETKNGRLIVVSDNNFIKDNFLSRSQEGLVFFLNAVDYLNSETDLMQIRSKLISEQPIPDLSDNTKQLIRWGNILIPFVFVGLIFILKRIIENSNDKKIIEALNN